jgi:hypothetical protein
MANSYIDLQTLKGEGGFDLATGTAYNIRLRSLAEHVSEQIDRWCNRHFYYRVQTRTFDGDGSTSLLVPDLISVSSIKEDSNEDGTFDTTWSSTDYILYPQNVDPTSTGGFSRPYNQLQVSQKSNGTQDFFEKGQANYQIEGTWGFQKISYDSGLNGTLANATATSLVLSGAVTGTIEPGHTCLIEDELVYVTNTAGTAATVVRGINGSTAAAHANQDVNVITYPGPVIEAVFTQVGRIWRRKDSAFGGSVGFPETGQFGPWIGGLDPDVKTLIGPYRKPAVGMP